MTKRLEVHGGAPRAKVRTTIEAGTMAPERSNASGAVYFTFRIAPLWPSGMHVSMHNEMKVLHVTLWPGPPFSGATINCHNFLKRLTPHHRARFVVPAPADSTEDMTSVALSRLGIPNEGVEIIRHRRIGLWDRAGAILLQDRLPYLAFVEGVFGHPLRKAVEQIVRDWNPEVMVVWFWGFAEALVSVKCGRRILYACDSVSLANRNQGRNSRSVARQVYHRMMARRCRTFEHTVLPHYDEVIFISSADAEHARLPSTVPVTVIGNGVDTPARGAGDKESDENGRPIVMFHGHLGFLPNQESVKFLVKQVGRYLEAELGADGFELRIIGGGATGGLRRMARRFPWLKLEGYVEDLHAALCKGTIYVAPLTMGAGAPNKVLDAMSCRLPVIGTETAFRGFPVTPGVHCLVCRLEEISENVVKLLRDPELRHRLGENAREWTAVHADWNVQAKLFDDVLRGKTKEPPPASST